MAMPELLRRSLYLVLPLAWVVSVLFAMSTGDRAGEQRARAEGDKALAELRQAYADQRTQVAEENLKRVQQQATRANQAEGQLLQAQQQVASLQSLLQERIPHVTTVYRPAPAAEPVAIPHCVFTAGWVRDFNLALGGADLSRAGEGASTGATAAATWPAPGAEEELLESGVTPADILAFAQDYGRWARNNLAQLNALLDLQKD